MGNAETLQWATDYKVHYCIPLWLRDAQIQLASARPLPRIAAHYDLRSDPIAIVCFGPSLNDTWEKIREFKYIMSCSGSHRFLLERAIIPTWHVAVDPQPKNTVRLIGPPHKDVEYLISSTCHPDVFDHLEGFNVKLWHVFSNEVDALRTLPPEEWALMGGPDVGLRSLVIARFFGFREFHVFGMDGCYGVNGTHAGEHPNSGNLQLGRPCELDGRTYYTTRAMMMCAKALHHELDSLKDVTATFYGEGLIQASMKSYVPNPPHESMIGFVKPHLISATYCELNRQLHRENLAYGVGGEKHADTVLKLAKLLKTKDILDYGCGKGRLGKGIPWHIQEYDPAILGKEESPKPADLVVCTDVLEHIEPDKLMLVLADLRRCVRQLGYFTIHMGPAQKLLADGRNTHLIQRDKTWWAEQLQGFFEVGKIIQKGVELYVVVGPRTRKQKRVFTSVVPELEAVFEPALMET